MAQKQHTPSYTVNIVSQRVGLSSRTIRLYEEAGLIEPARVGGNRQRMYSDQDISWLRCIRDMIHEESLTVAGIRKLLDFAPCWEIRECPEEVARVCRPNLNIPDVGRKQAAGARRALGEPVDEDEGADAHEAGVRIRLIYGVEELGAVLPCARCITAERVARRVALKFPGRVTVSKHDMLSEEASSLGAIIPPAVLVDDELVTMGKSVQENQLESVVTRHLKPD